MNPIVLIIMLVLALVTSFAFAPERYIGWGWALFFCLTLSPFISLALTLISPKKVDGYERPINANPLLGKILAYAFIIVGAITCLLVFFSLFLPAWERGSIIGVIPCAGVLGLGFYLLKK